MDENDLCTPRAQRLFRENLINGVLTLYRCFYCGCKYEVYRNLPHLCPHCDEINPTTLA